ncbi:MAG: hypothetical protein MJE68_19505, partial [Proteobacteria bacterium]|nr:hypothetical protein [Pseudomonadota bacterium]
MYDTNGKVEISNSTFAKNSVQKCGNDSGGGGFAVEFTYCKPGDNTCSNEYDPLYKRNANSTYTFDDCIFLENQAIQNHLDIVNIKVSRNYHDATGQGGGLSIHIKGDAKNNSFILSNSQFIKNNATWGGGLLIEMDDTSTNSSIVVSGCNFSNNSAATVQDVESKYHNRYTGGGAIDVIATPHDRSTLHIRDCRFTYNQAFEGGAIYFSTARQTYFDQLFDVIIADSLFESNHARLGSAMVLTNFPVNPSGFLPKIHICDCTFVRNSYSNGTYP